MRYKSNASPRRSSIKIICVNTGIIPIEWVDGTVTEFQGDKCPLELYETYTTPGPVVADDGLICYPINEHGGNEMMAQRFVVYNNKAKTHSKPKTRTK